MNGINLAELAVASGTAGGSFGLVFVAVRWTANFIAGRMDKRQEHIDAAQQSLIEAMGARIDEESKSRIAESERRALVEKELRDELSEVRTALRKCQEQHGEARAEVMELRAMMKGLGDARQHAQLIVSEEKRKAKQ